MAKKTKDEGRNALDEAFGAQTQQTEPGSLPAAGDAGPVSPAPSAGANGAAKKRYVPKTPEERERLLYYSIRGMARGSSTWDVIAERPRKKTAMRYIDSNRVLLQRVYGRLEIVKCKRAVEVWRS